MGGGSVSVGKLQLSGASIYLPDGQAAACFAAQPSEGEAKELAYFVVLRRSPRTGNDSSTESPVARSDNKEAACGVSLTFNDKKFELLQRFDVDGQTLSNESFTIDGKQVDTAKGRLFLVDFSGDAPTVVQKDVPLPAKWAEGNLNDTATVESVAQEALSYLPRQDEEIARFIKAAGE